VTLSRSSHALPRIKGGGEKKMKGTLEEFEEGKENAKIITLMAADTLNHIQMELENELEDWGHLIPNETVDCLNKAKDLISQAISKIHGL
jgi:hypothetical protein